MRLGLIARCEIARGIAIQSRNFYDHMGPMSVLLVRMPKPDCTEAPEWYPGATHVQYDVNSHTLPESAVKAWLRSVDVVFTVETPNDWRMPRWCREMGVKLVIQGNPEFVRHGRPGFEDLPHPDAWWWPTSWRAGQVPSGAIVPVPMPSIGAPSPRRDGPLRVLHVVGKRAFADRNGTDILVQALRRTRQRMDVTIIGLDGQLPHVQKSAHNRGLTVNYIPDGVTDRWDMYADQDVLVLPRRYGGLCLPALEAGVMGLAVMMPDCSPNEELAAIRVPVRRTEPLQLACGEIQASVVNPLDLAAALDDLALSDAALRQAKYRQETFVHRWSDWVRPYTEMLARIATT